MLGFGKSMTNLVSKHLGRSEPALPSSAAASTSDHASPSLLSPPPAPAVRSDGTFAVFDVMWNQGHQAVVVCDDHGRMRNANPAARRLLGLLDSSWRGRPLSDWLSIPVAESANKQRYWATVAEGNYALKRWIDDPSDPQTSNEEGAAPPRLPRLQLRVVMGREADMDVPVVLLQPAAAPPDLLRKVEKLSLFDSLTGLHNRDHFRLELSRAMARARRSGRAMALFFLDLDRFKLINDSLGHAAGDELLKQVAELLSRCLRGADTLLVAQRNRTATLSRVGGDEFTLILEDIGGVEDAAIVARRLLEALARPFLCAGEELQVSTSIGIALYPTDDVDMDGMIRHADMAMYRSKALGRNTFSFFSDDLNATVKARLSLEGSLRRAIELQEFQLHYQPKANLQTRRVTGVEALIRWHCPGRGMVPPDRFINVLEDTGLIVQVGAWVIREACQQMARWDAAGLPALSVAVNLSARQLRHAHLISLVRDSLQQAGIAPQRLELELTESMIMEDTEGNRAVLAAFGELGVRLAIDDFGTGHSSLSYLKRLDVDTLKLDRSFVSQLPEEPEDAAIATAVVALGKSLDMHVVAEGVETEAQARFLAGLGCHEMQGWLLCKALAPDVLTVWLQERQRESLMHQRLARMQHQEVNELVNLDLSDSFKPGAQ
jgi:diguanylate cyclase (GGDEF)-like protein